ncbi:hypothetical protein [Pantoea phage Nufs112]|jgi:hypothetical protein|nr:hypothetical protein [Pantoea phage Nufs112]
MQGNAEVVKFKKKPKTGFGAKDLESRDRMRKRDKTQRGGGSKETFLTSPDSVVNQGAYYIQYEG